MRLTKLGHCCLVIEIDGVRILTDPGAWTTAQNEQYGIKAVLISHEHSDHLDIESVKKILKNNPDARIITNRSVSMILKQAGLLSQVVGHKSRVKISGVLIEGVGKNHAPIYPPIIPNVENTGYMINQRFYYPGDGFFKPNKPVECLALPVAGPWMKIAHALDFAKALKPRLALPVHDGMLAFAGPFHTVPELVLANQGIRFQALKIGRVLKC